MAKISAYFSHSIRGQSGKDATDAEVEKNCKVAERVAAWIRENIPEIDLYVPAEHEDFVAICWREKYLSEDQILEIDCKILGKQDFHIVYEVDGWLGGGIGIEINHAKKIGKLIFYITHLDEVTLAALRVVVRDMLQEKHDERLRNEHGI